MSKGMQIEKKEKDRRSEPRDGGGDQDACNSYSNNHTSKQMVVKLIPQRCVFLFCDIQLKFSTHVAIL